MLVGTTSIEKSEQLSELLKKRKIQHNVLNARYHEQEAFIVAQAGVPGAVTIATNMAGRGTDIQLGGNADMRIKAGTGRHHRRGRARRARSTRIRAEVAANKQKALAAGGLYMIGTERHESRRIDNQLRGRSGRQGDPGASKFFLSLQDDLMRIFGSERMDAILTTLGLEPGEAITHPWVNKALEKAQQKVEARNFEIRKNILKYDNVLNDQRKVIFEQRKRDHVVGRCLRPDRRFPRGSGGDAGRPPHPGKGLCRAMGRRRACRTKCSSIFGVDLPVRGLDQGRRHRRRGSARAHPEGGGSPRRRPRRRISAPK